MRQPDETIANNLAALMRRSLSVSERELAHISDAAERLVERVFSEPMGIISENEPFLTEYRELRDRIFSGTERNEDGIPEQSRRWIDALSDERRTEQAVALCAAVCQKMRERGKPLGFGSFFPTGETDGDGKARIAYLKNSYSDSAYRVFSSVLKNAAVTYPRDFNGVCEEVYYGRCRYCILPVETLEEGALTSFRRLARKFDLCPVLSCTVSSGDGAQTTRFILFSKSIERIECPSAGAVFSFRLTSRDSQAYLCALKALSLCGLRLMKIDSSPVSWDDGRYSLEFSAECGDGDLTVLICYLTLELPEYDPIGIYSQL